MKYLRGQSIVETVIAAALISVAVIAALSLANHSQKQNIYAKNLSAAELFASQTLDWIRGQREQLGWATLAAKAELDSQGEAAIYCLSELPGTDSDFTELEPSVCATDSFIPNTRYIREITVDTTRVGEGILTVISTVTWQEQEVRTATLELELASWH